ADGYTYLLAPASVLAVDQYMAKILPYSPEDGFASVARAGSIPFALIATPELTVNTLAELIALAKANPGKLAFASPGPRTLPGMLGETLKIRAGVSLLQVPYKGVQDTIAGRIQLAIQGIPAIAAVVQRGQLRALAVSSPRRIPELPEVAAFSETLPGFEFNGWFAAVALAASSPVSAQQKGGKHHTLAATLETVQWGWLDPNEPPKLKVNSGDTISIETMMHSHDKIKPGITMDEIIALRKANPGGG